MMLNKQQLYIYVIQNFGFIRSAILKLYFFPQFVFLTESEFMLFKWNLWQKCLGSGICDRTFCGSPVLLVIFAL